MRPPKTDHNIVKDHCDGVSLYYNYILQGSIQNVTFCQRSGNFQYSTYCTISLFVKIPENSLLYTLLRNTRHFVFAMSSHNLLREILVIILLNNYYYCNQKFTFKYILSKSLRRYELLIYKRIRKDTKGYVHKMRNKLILKN